MGTREYKRLAMKEIIFKSFSLGFNVLEKERWGWGKSLCDLQTSKRKGNLKKNSDCMWQSSSNLIVQEVGRIISL